MKTMKWINIKDRLPEHMQVVVIDWPDNPHTPFVARYRKDHLKQFLRPLGADKGIEEITHWLPLPILEHY